MAQTGRSNVRYVDPQRRYTVVLGPSWNAPFEALPHDDRAGTHDSADGRCGAYASIGCGQAPTKIFRRYPQSAVCSPLEFRHERRARLVTGILSGRPYAPQQTEMIKRGRLQCRKLHGRFIEDSSRINATPGRRLYLRTNSRSMLKRPPAVTNAKTRPPIMARFL